MKEKNLKWAACFLAAAGFFLSGCGETARVKEQEMPGCEISDAFLTVYDDGAGKDGESAASKHPSVCRVQGTGRLHLAGYGERDVYDVTVSITWQEDGALEEVSDMDIEVTMPHR